MKRLLLATSNTGKARELRLLLPSVAIDTLLDVPELAMPPESASTFEENARAKAEFAARALSIPVLADDSGLEVDALGGAPGVASARWVSGSDSDRNERLLELLRDIEPEARSARFVCALAFARSDAATVVVREVVEGSIAGAPRGKGGFGYDPVFVPHGESRTMAELSRAEKNALSHRGRALRAMLPRLESHFSLEIEGAGRAPSLRSAFDGE